MVNIWLLLAAVEPLYRIMPDAAESERLLISNLISTQTIELSLRGAHRDEVLTQLVARVPEIADRPEARQSLLQALQEREQLHSTGIGDGLALPHARNALAGLVERPAIVFGRHEPGIPYGSIDAKPARLFFLLVTTSVTQHLHVLARISRLVRDPKLRQHLLVANRPETILQHIREAEAKM
jgi:mannitol/fructose-specific phosphotransferase system IIA component (Ntr-type)